MVGFPPRTSCVTPVLPGPGSETRMKMGWKIMTKRNILGSGFSRMQRVCGGGGYFRCLQALWTGYGKDRTALRGRPLVVPRAPVHIRVGGAQLSGRILESGVGHCLPVCGGLPHPYEALVC